jgi:hypothetical protein
MLWCFSFPGGLFGGYFAPLRPFFGPFQRLFSPLLPSSDPHAAPLFPKGFRHASDRQRRPAATVVKKELNLDRRPGEILQILTVTLFEKTPLLQTLAHECTTRHENENRNQLSLSDF